VTPTFSKFWNLEKFWKIFGEKKPISTFYLSGPNSFKTFRDREMMKKGDTDRHIQRKEDREGHPDQGILKGEVSLYC